MLHKKDSKILKKKKQCITTTLGLNDNFGIDDISRIICQNTFGAWPSRLNLAECSAAVNIHSQTFMGEETCQS